MPSFEHEVFVELFRNSPRLAVELLRHCGGITVKHEDVEQGSIDLSQISPTEYRADYVVILRDDTRRPVLGVVVEIQRDDDTDKRWSWPVYVTGLRASLRCAAMLLVVAPKPNIAAWARRPIEIGHPGFQLTPIVVESSNIPDIRDADAASDIPELAVLSALAHPTLETARIAIKAVSRLSEDLRRLYTDIILAAVPEPVRRQLEATMKDRPKSEFARTYQYKSEFARMYYGQGLEEGRQQGKEEGKEEGRQQGKEEGRRDGLITAVLELGRAKLETISADELAGIASLSDTRALNELFTALAQAPTAAAARAALARAILANTDDT